VLLALGLGLGCASKMPGGEMAEPVAPAGGRATGGSRGMTPGAAGAGGAMGTGGASAGGGSAGAASGGGTGGVAIGSGGGSGGAAAPADVAPADPMETGSAEVPASPPGAGITDALTQQLVTRGIGLAYYHLCVITPDKSVRCFGDKANPGDPRVNPPGGIKPDQLHAAHNGFCFIQPPGGAERVRCWGHNPSSFPRGGVTKDTDPIQVGHGYDFGCVLNRDSSVKCWGSEPAVKYPAPPGLKAKALTIAAHFACAIKVDDTVQCWGIEPPNPPDPALKVKLLAAVYHGNNKLRDNPKGENHACAILMDDSVKCWGQEVAGNLTPPPGLRAKDVAVATSDSCAVTLEGDVVCWGTSRYNGDDPVRQHPRPMGIKAKGIRASMTGYCALKLDDTLACWGDEQHDHLSFPPDLKVYAP
jgi:hypothetical protein